MEIVGCLCIGFIALIVLLGIWGVLIEPRMIDTRKEVAFIRHLPSRWEGRVIAVIADLQVGMPLANTDTIRRIVQRVVAARPAAVLIAGDFLYHPKHKLADQIDTVVKLLRPLRAAGLPVYAVLGNHDYDIRYRGDPKDMRAATQLLEALEGLKVRVLRNEAVKLALPDDDRGTNTQESLYLVGVGSYEADEDDVTVALSEVPKEAARLVLMHHPRTFGKLPPFSAPLAVAAHTHGGQVRLPGMRRWSWMALRTRHEVHADGWVDGYGESGNHLYVNRGIGFSVVPVRINCPPELTLFTLLRATEPEEREARHIQPTQEHND